MADPLLIVPYRGYANLTNLWLKGRILEDENISSGKNESHLRNLIDSFKRFETDEIPGATVSMEINGRNIKTQSDEEGYFTFDVPWSPQEFTDESQWLQVKLEMNWKDVPILKNIGEVYLPASAARYGIITDMDDTILQTHVTSPLRLKMLYSTFLRDAHHRLPMEGMVELMQKMAFDVENELENPVFYVSNSPWNIYDVLEEFLQLQNLPKGPLLLRDYGLKRSEEFSNHKMITIRRILKTYPSLPFVMLGDTASEDADHYIDLAREFPGQIKAIYIRLTRNNKNAKRVAKLVEANTSMNAVLVNNSADIYTHAVQNGFIS